MFTGLIEGTGTIREIGRRGGGDTRLMIEPSFDMSGLKTGDSVSVDGACLTVTHLSASGFNLEVSEETLTRTTLGLRRQGDIVNLERALKLSDRLGGHLVSGHVDGMGRVERKEQRKGSWGLRIRVDKKLSRYIIEKGSVAVDGISLTVNACGEDYFDVNIIAQTGKETTLLDKKTGDMVNIENDLIGKYVEKLFPGNLSSEERKRKRGDIDFEMLAKQGFGE